MCQENVQSRVTQNFKKKCEEKSNLWTIHLKLQQWPLCLINAYKIIVFLDMPKADGSVETKLMGELQSL